MRENRRSGTSLVMFSRDEGKTWSRAVDAPWGLTGDRHHGIRLPDGRMVIVFRNAAPRPDKDVPQDKGGFIAWVGTYDDIRQGRPGQVRVSLLRTFKDGFYPGIHQLPDGTIVATTYTPYGKDDVGCSIVSVRFTLAAGAAVDTGAQPFTLASAAGTAGFSVTVLPLLPVLSIEPLPLAVAPDNIARTFRLRLSNADSIAHTVNLASASTAIASAHAASPVTSRDKRSVARTELSVNPEGVGVGVVARSE
jgi:hypothetical protein